MHKAFKVINEMFKDGILKNYAIGGAVAVMYYTEPFDTFDLDIFFIPDEKEKIIVLTPFYNYLTKRKKYKTYKEYIMINGTPIQFIPAADELEKEAVENAIEINYKDIKLKIIRVEYLMAIFLKVQRKKDILKLLKILDEAKIDYNLLNKILEKYGLTKTFENFKNNYYGKRN